MMLFVGEASWAYVPILRLLCKLLVGFSARRVGICRHVGFGVGFGWHVEHKGECEVAI
jgi:hypothetical protein